MADWEGFDPKAIAHDTGVLVRLEAALRTFERAATEAAADMNEPEPARDVLDYIADIRAGLDASKEATMHALGRLPDPEERGRAARSHAVTGCTRGV